MRARPPRGALGLRGRIVGAVLVTTVETLAVVVVALLGPLEHELRSAALSNLQKELGKSTTANCAKPPLTDIGVPRIEQTVSGIVRDQVRALANRIGSGTFVQVLGYPDASGLGERVLPAPLDSDSALDTLSDVSTAFPRRTRR
jgi:hypothetical protein